MDRTEFIKLLQSNRDQALPMLAQAVAESIVTPLEEATAMVKRIVVEGYTPLDKETNDCLIQTAVDCRVIAPLLPVKYILIERAEGLHEECGKPVLILAQPMELEDMPRHYRLVLGAPDNIWRKAQEEMRKIAHTAPKGGCYDKTDFWVEWVNGEKYQGRADIKHVSEPDNDTDLAEHMWHFVTFYAGRRRPGWMSDQQYAEVKERNKQHVPEYEPYYFLYDLGVNTY